MDARLAFCKPHLALGLLLCFTMGAWAQADPTYNVIDLGAPEDVRIYPTDGVVRNDKTGVSYSFPQPVNHFDASQPPSNLPSATYWDQVSNDRFVTYPMKVSWENALGTVIGGVPDGSSHSFPYQNLTNGYSVRLPDGSYSPLVVLPDTNLRSPFHYDPYAQIYLNDSNQILTSTYQGTSVLDLRTNTNVGLDSLLSGYLSKDKYYFGLNAFGFSNNGSVLAEVLYGTHPDFGGAPQSDVFLLTPLSVPEPAPIATMLVALGGFAFCRLRRRATIARTTA